MAAPTDSLCVATCPTPRSRLARRAHSSLPSSGSSPSFEFSLVELLNIESVFFSLMWCRRHLLTSINICGMKMCARPENWIKIENRHIGMDRGSQDSNLANDFGQYKKVFSFLSFSKPPTVPMSLCVKCIKGVTHEGTPKGEVWVFSCFRWSLQWVRAKFEELIGCWERIGGVDTYVATPSNTHSENTAILFLTDAFGPQLVNSQAGYLFWFAVAFVQRSCV